jgi:hypothetical protein
MSPLLKGFVYAVACALITLWFRMPDALVIVVAGLGGVVGALD